MYITVINTLPVPSGEASVNRILSYSKELVKIGNEVVIMSSGYLPGALDFIDGVRVNNLGKKLPKPLSLACALWGMTKKLLASKTDVVILVSNALLLIWPLFIVCRIKGIKYVQEKSEFPFPMIKKGVINQLYSKLYIRTTYKPFDGMIVMTKPLLDFYGKYVRKKSKLFEMPMTVDVDRFIKALPSENTIGDYVAYCGSLSITNGIDNLIEAFSFVEPQFPNLKLVIIGGAPNEKVMNDYRDMVSWLGLRNVVFYGKVDRNEMPSLLKNAKALLLARRSNLQAAGGFPTKLGEYLATGNPVVVTAVGDIPLYLNEANSFIVKPDDNKAFADRIMEVMTDEDNAARIGKEGQRLALTVFNAEIQSRKLNDFLLSLLSID